METYAQQSIRHCMEMIAPFEMPERQEEGGQSPFYEFMLSLYQEMYQNPEAYLVFPKPYDDAQTGALVMRKKDYAKVIEQMDRIHESKCYMRKTAHYLRGSKSSFLSVYANAPIIAGAISGASRGRSAVCSIGQRS